MAQASKSKQHKRKKAAVEPRPQGHQNMFSGAKLDFLESYKDQFLDSTDHGAFYTFISKAFIEWFGYNLAIEVNPGPDNDDMLTPQEINTSLSEDEQNCYIPFHSSDSDSFSDRILDSDTCHQHYALHIFSLSFRITFLLHLFTPVPDRKPNIGLYLVYNLSYFCL